MIEGQLPLMHWGDVDILRMALAQLPTRTRHVLMSHARVNVFKCSKQLFDVWQEAETSVAASSAKTMPVGKARHHRWFMNEDLCSKH